MPTDIIQTMLQRLKFGSSFASSASNNLSTIRSSLSYYQNGWDVVLLEGQVTVSLRDVPCLVKPFLLSPINNSNITQYMEQTDRKCLNSWALGDVAIFSNMLISNTLWWMILQQFSWWEWIHGSTVDPPDKRPVMRRAFPCHGVIINIPMTVFPCLVVAKHRQTFRDSVTVFCDAILQLTNYAISGELSMINR